MIRLIGIAAAIFGLVEGRWGFVGAGLVLALFGGRRRRRPGAAVPSDGATNDRLLPAPDPSIPAAAVAVAKTFAADPDCFDACDCGGLD